MRYCLVASDRHDVTIAVNKQQMIVVRHSEGPPQWGDSTGATAGFHAKLQRNLGLDFVIKQYRSLQKLQPVLQLSTSEMLTRVNFPTLAKADPRYDELIRNRHSKLLIVDDCIHTHTHRHPFNGPFSGTTRVSRYQKDKTNLDFSKARDSEWQWHQLGHMQVCT